MAFLGARLTTWHSGCAAPAEDPPATSPSATMPTAHAMNLWLRIGKTPPFPARLTLNRRSHIRGNAESGSVVTSRATRPLGPGGHWYVRGVQLAVRPYRQKRDREATPARNPPRRSPVLESARRRD